ncbi:MAG TPA: ROK family protein [Anaerolineae bacterium]|nr:ROK family protein [Anaerolineae bacterium]
MTGKETNFSQPSATPAGDGAVLVGLDIGGTKTEALIVDRGMNQLAQVVRPTEAGDPEKLIAGVKATVQEALANSGKAANDIDAIGIAVPGLVDPATGTVRLAVNLNLVSYPLGPVISDSFRARGYLENDVRTGAMGAFRYANRTERVRNLAYLSIGTGIASGVILNGRLHRGVNGMAGEIGHVIMEPGGYRCGCGMPGCLEAVAAGPAVARLGEEWIAAGINEEPITTRAVYAAAGRGDHDARRVVGQISRYLARAIQLLIMAYDVEKVVLGGGVSRSGEAFLAPILAALADLRSQSDLAMAMLPDEKILLLPANYSAGAWGAIILAQQAPDYSTNVGQGPAISDPDNSEPDSSGSDVSIPGPSGAKQKMEVIGE